MIGRPNTAAFTDAVLAELRVTEANLDADCDCTACTKHLSRGRRVLIPEEKSAILCDPHCASMWRARRASRAGVEGER